MPQLKINKFFGAAPNDFLNDENISLKAKGLYTYLNSKPDGWNFNGKRITMDHDNGETSVYSGLDELEKHGYLKREEYRNDKGQFVHQYTLFANPVRENPDRVNHETKKEREQRNNNTSPASGTEVSSTKQDDSYTLVDEDEAQREDIDLGEEEDDAPKYVKKSPVRGLVEDILDIIEERTGHRPTTTAADYMRVKAAYEELPDERHVKDMCKDVIRSGEVAELGYNPSIIFMTNRINKYKKEWNV